MKKQVLSEVVLMNPEQIAIAKKVKHDYYIYCDLYADNNNKTGVINVYTLINLVGRNKFFKFVEEYSLFSRDTIVFQFHKYANAKFVMK